jgi:type II secretory pathway component PulF
MASLISAGVPIVTALDICRTQTESAKMSSALGRVEDRVRRGEPFSAALGQERKVFNDLYVSMVEAGENGGFLDQVMRRLSELAEFDEEIRNKVKSAMWYPALVVLSIIGAFTIFITFVIPKFASFYRSAGVDLPLPTRILIGISNVVENYWYWTLGGVAAVVIGFVWLIRTPWGRYWFDYAKMRVPIFGKLMIKISMSRFCRFLGHLMKSGVPIMQTLGVVSRVTGSVELQGTIERASERVSKGEPLSEVLTGHRLIPVMVTQMMAVGEKTGGTDDFMIKVSEYYDEETAYRLRTLSTTIEPILLVFVGGAVLLMALAIYLPMWNMVNLLHK